MKTDFLTDLRKLTTVVSEHLRQKSLGVSRIKSVGEYWSLYHEMLPNFGPVALGLTH